MRKWIRFCCCLLAVLTLASCAPSVSETPDPTEEPTGEPTAEPTDEPTKKTGIRQTPLNAGGTMTVQLSADPEEDPFNVTSAACPDPFVTFDARTDYYYGLSTQNSVMVLHRSKLLKDLFVGGESLTVYTTGKEILESIWAPEMIYRGGKWYIYSSGTTDPVDKTKHLFVLESNTDDPFDGFTFKAYLDNTMFAIDPSPFVRDGVLYLAVSQVIGGYQWISLVKMKNPYTISQVSAISNPRTYSWENNLDEGPFVVVNGDRTFIIYSANGCYNDGYCLGVLEYTGSSVFLKPSNWKKYDQPIFVKANGNYAPGHASFFYSPDGTELWIAYQCYYSPNTGDRRRFRVCHTQKVGFDEEGFPLLGEPLARNTVIAVPSGE